MRRPTIQDVAKRADVTAAAVSFALNGRPGVSEETRRRVVRIAREIGYRPNRAARALSMGTAGALGMVIDRPARSIGTEPFFMQLIAGIQSELSSDGAGTALLFRMADDAGAESATYRDWWSAGHVDGVFLVNPHCEDQRFRELQAVGMPAIVLGSAETTLPTIASDETPFARQILLHLHDLGHREVARVSGPRTLVHTVERDIAYARVAAELGMNYESVVGDYSRDTGIGCTSELLSRRPRPTAILYDNDVMALAGLETARAQGVSVPEELSIASWDDSILCELAQPNISALTRDVSAFGAYAARSLLELTRGREPSDDYVETRSLTVRDSTARATREVRP